MKIQDDFGRTANRGLLLMSIVLISSGWFVETLDNGVALTPPMGWMSWLRFECNQRCDIDKDNCISERLYRQMADRMSKDGYLAAGYTYVAIDDCWMTRNRSANNTLQADPTRFPSGIKALADYVHSRGLKLGLYLDIGTTTCAGYPGSKNFFDLDATTMADWGVDFVKMDGCNANVSEYRNDFIAFGQSLNRTGRQMVYYCEWPMYARYYGQEVDYRVISATCNMFRALTDIYYIYHSVDSMIDYFSRDPYNMSLYAGPGAWNDADCLAIGNFGLSDNQERLQMGMWSIMALPLIMGNDLRDIRPSSKALLQNKNVIAINQDPLGKQGVRIAQYISVSVWVKQILPPGSLAVAFMNQQRSGGPQLVIFSLSNLPQLDPSLVYTVTEVFDNKFVGRYKLNDTLKVFVNPMGIFLVKVLPSRTT